MSGVIMRDGNRVATTQLVSLAIAESSPVTAGDNPDADIVLLKMKAEADKRKVRESSVKKGLWQTLKEKLGVVTTTKDYAPRTVGQILAQDRVQDELWKLRMALMESVYSIMDCAPMEEWAKLFSKNSDEMNAEMDRIIASLGSTGKAQELKALFSDFNAAAKALDAGDRGKANQMADALKRIEEFSFGATAPGAPTQEQEEVSMSGVTKNKGASALSKALDGIKDEKVRALIVKAHEEELEEARAGSAPAPAAAIQAGEGASDSPAMKSLMAKLDSVLESNQKLTENNKILAEKVESLTSDKAVSKHRAVAKKLVADGLDADVASVANQLQKAYARSEEDGKELEEMFKGMAARSEFADTMGAQIGAMTDSLEPSEDGGNEAHNKLDSMAKARAEKDGISYARAYKRVADENPKLKRAAIRSTPALSSG